MDVALQAPGSANLTVFAGQDVAHKFTFKTRNLEGETELQNLTGQTARLQVRLYVGAPEPVLDLTSENGGLVMGGALGTIQVNIPRAQLAELEVNREYRYGLKTYSGSTARRRLEGTLTVVPGVTEDA